MKAILEFNLPDDSAQYGIHQNSFDMFGALIELQRLVRDLSKGYKEFDLDQIIDELNDILYNSNIDTID